MNELILISVAVSSGLATFIVLPKLLARRGVGCLP